MVRERWGLSCPKHKVEINGEMLISRTVRLLKENGITDIWITSHDASYEIPGIKRYEPIDNQFKIDQFWACIPIWEGQQKVIFLFGDVYFSEVAMKTICSHTVDGYAYFQRTKASKITGKRWKEGFAFVVENIDKFKKACEFLHNDAKNELPEMHHNISAYLEGKPIADYLTHWREIGPHGVEIDDETDDFDNSRDLINWRKYTKIDNKALL